MRQANTAPEAERALHRELATGDIRIYKVEVAGTNSRMAGALRDPAIAVVLPHAGDSRVTQLRDHRASLARSKPDPAKAPPIRLLSEGSPQRYVHFGLAVELGALFVGLCGRYGGNECEQAGLGLDQDLAGDKAFELGA